MLFFILPFLSLRATVYHKWDSFVNNGTDSENDRLVRHHFSVSLPLRRPYELDLEAAAVGGLAVAAARIVEVEDDFAGETDCRFAHILRRKPLRGLDYNLLGRGGHDFAGVHHRLYRIIHLKRDLAVGTEREVLALNDNLPSDIDLANLAALRMSVLDDAARGWDLTNRLPLSE